jgi:bacterioferritin
MSEFLIDIERLRREARQQTDEGAVTTHYKADRAQVLKMLDAALATEWICVLRYTQHALAARGIHAEAVADEFSEHAREEQEHAHMLSERIKQLGGTPSLDPRTLAGRSHSEYKECDTLVDMIKENLIAERIAIESYTEMIKYLGEADITSRRVLEEILAKEEEHADEMADLLAALDVHDKLH